MADDPSIDEILASLDRLLNEGDGRNDDISDNGDKRSPSAAPQHQAEDMPDEASAAPVESESAAGASLGDAAEGEMAAGDTLGGNLAARADPDVRRLDRRDTDTGPRKLLLSEAMLVESPQATLPFDVSGSARVIDTDADASKADEAETNEASPSSVGSQTDDTPRVRQDGALLALDASALDELAAGVATQVSKRLARVLPPLVDQLVREELAARMSAMESDGDGRESPQTD